MGNWIDNYLTLLKYVNIIDHISNNNNYFHIKFYCIRRFVLKLINGKFVLIYSMFRILKVTLTINSRKYLLNRVNYLWDPEYAYLYRKHKKLNVICISLIKNIYNFSITYDKQCYHLHIRYQSQINWIFRNGYCFQC